LGREGDGLADLALREPFLDRPFELAVKIWRVNNAIVGGDDQAIHLRTIV
jgi:hypothetical protein